MYFLTKKNTYYEKENQKYILYHDFNTVNYTLNYEIQIKLVKSDLVIFIIYQNQFINVFKLYY